MSNLASVDAPRLRALATEGARVEAQLIVTTSLANTAF